MFDGDDYIREIIRGIIDPELPEHVKEFLEPGKLARRLEAESLPDSMVHILEAVCPISNKSRIHLNNLFAPIPESSDSSINLRYKKQIIVLEREISIIEKNYQTDKPFIQFAKNVIAKNTKRIETLQESCTKYSEKIKAEWEKEADRIKQKNPANRSASLLARIISKNLGYPDSACESIRKHLLSRGFKAHEKRKISPHK
ncbi:hypothetical protein [Nitrosomonas supralitoralis]|uniref:Uncharacterized protein n=1 Tax=Nitrosomonas supralitoralis TaxID=2116706 RepID=A0A2P7NYK7_9PROT|nr:hypothetical protein [Nitrosomonas supralitoralis]PSJ18522.1 hypothetical protein C7H79_02770 [Nitrosomonas supralitoralis]